jgi:hypothetical protein
MPIQKDLDGFSIVERGGRTSDTGKRRSPDWRSRRQIGFLNRATGF